MKRSMVALLLLVTVLIGTADAQNVTYSTYDKYDLRNGDFAVVGMTGNLLYNYRAGADGYFLDAYNDSMNKVAVVKLDFFPDKIYQVHFIAYPDKIIVLYQALESNKVVQYAALLDEKGILKKNPVQLGTVKIGIFGATRTYFSSAVSEDKKMILVYSAEDRGSEIEFDGKWIDETLTVVKRGKAKFSGDNTMQHGEVNLTNDGTMYMAAFSPVGTSNYADQFWILTLPAGTTKFIPKEMPLQSKYATNGYMKVDNANKQVYFGGFYSDKKNGSYDGIIYATYDITSGTYTNKKLIPFDQDLIAAAGARKKKHAFDNFQVKQLIVKNDGGFLLISEETFITTRSNYTPGFGYYSFYNSSYSNSMVREYHYDDIMTISYDKDGLRQWSTFVPKSQYSQDDGGLFSSYALLNTGGAIAFLFNDFNTSHSRIQLATLDAAGKADMRSFSAEGNEYPDWLPKSGKQVSARVLVVPCLHKRQICFARVVF